MNERFHEKGKGTVPATANEKRNRFSGSSRNNNKKAFHAKWTELKLHLNSNRLYPRVSAERAWHARAKGQGNSFKTHLSCTGASDEPDHPLQMSFDIKIKLVVCNVCAR